MKFLEIKVQKIAFGNKEHTTDRKWESQPHWDKYGKEFRCLNI